MEVVDRPVDQVAMQEVALDLPWDQRHTSRARLLHKPRICRKCSRKVHNSNKLWSRRSMYPQLCNRVHHRDPHPGHRRADLEVDHARIRSQSRAALLATRMALTAMSPHELRRGQRRPRLSEVTPRPLALLQNHFVWQQALRVRCEAFDRLVWVVREHLGLICKKCPEPLRRSQLIVRCLAPFSSMHHHRAC